MASIFDGTQPPAWLTEATRQKKGQLGDIAGLAFGAGINALQRDPNAPSDASFLESRKGVGEGITEARLSSVDPMWKLHVATAQAQQLSQMAQAESAFALAKERSAETQAWMVDAPTLSPWLTARPEDRLNMPEPVAQSKTGLGMIEKTTTADSQYFIKQQAQQQLLEATKLRVENNATKLKDLQLWDNAAAELSPQERTQIDALNNNGRDQSGALTPEARTMIDGFRSAAGKPPVGTAPSVEAAGIRAKTEASKAQSPIGKLEADKVKAIDSGAPEEVIAAYDAAIKKATETGGLYSEKPEVIEVEGKKFLKWGKQLRDLTDTSAKSKAEISLLTSKIRGLQNLLIKDPKNKSANQQLLDAKKELDKHFEITPKPSTSTAPSASAAPPSDQLISTDDPPKNKSPASSDAKDPLGLFK
jgi:hypothetical protein